MSATLEILMVPGMSSPQASTLFADPTTLTADGISTLLVTLRTYDANANARGIGGDVVVLNVTLGLTGAVTDDGDVTYHATFLAPTTAGVARCERTGQRLTRCSDGSAGSRPRRRVVGTDL